MIAKFEEPETRKKQVLSFHTAAVGLSHPVGTGVCYPIACALCHAVPPSLVLSMSVTIAKVLHGDSRSTTFLSCKMELRVPSCSRKRGRPSSSASLLPSFLSAATSTSSMSTTCVPHFAEVTAVPVMKPQGSTLRLCGVQHAGTNVMSYVPAATIFRKRTGGVIGARSSLARTTAVLPRRARLLDAEGHSVAAKTRPETSKNRRSGDSGRISPSRHRRPSGTVSPPPPSNDVRDACGTANKRGVLDDDAHGDGSSPRLVERQKALAKDVKAKGQRRDWRGALMALRSAEGPLSIQCYNAAVSAMAVSGRWQEALALLGDMRRDGIAADAHTYSAAMRACGMANQAEDAIALLDAMRRGTAVRPDVFCYNVCIGACGKVGSYERALSLLGEMRVDGITPDVVSFNSVINALGMAGRWEDALGVMEDMVLEQVTPNSVTYASAINACGKSRQLRRALGLLREAHLAGIEVGTSAYNAAIAACGHAGSAEEALPLLDDMRKKGVARSVITYSSLIDVCGKSGLPDTSLRLLQEMKDEGIAPNAITYNALIHASAGGGLKSGDLDMSSPSPGHGNNIDEVVSAGGQEVGREEQIGVTRADSDAGERGRRRWDRVMPLLEEMKTAGHKPDLLSYNLALAACARKGQAARTLQLLGDMRAAGMLPTAVSFSTAVASCERAGKVAEALALLDRMKSGGVQRTPVTFDSALLACAKAGRRTEALRLLTEMREEEVPLDEKAFRLAIQACGRAGDSAGALVLLRGMSKAGILPGEHALASTMEAFAKAGDVGQVLALVEEARALSDDGRPFWSCTLIGAKMCAATGMAEDAINLLRELAPDNAPADGEHTTKVSINQVTDATSGVSVRYAEERQENNTSAPAVAAAGVTAKSGDGGVGNVKGVNVSAASTQLETEEDGSAVGDDAATVQAPLVGSPAAAPSFEMGVSHFHNRDRWLRAAAASASGAPLAAIEATFSTATPTSDRGTFEGRPLPLVGRECSSSSSSSSSSMSAVGMNTTICSSDTNGSDTDGSDTDSGGTDSGGDSSARTTANRKSKAPRDLGGSVRMSNDQNLRPSPASQEVHGSYRGNASEFTAAGVNAATDGTVGRREGAWREALWAAARAGQASTTVELLSAIREEEGLTLTGAHYNKALRMLADFRRAGGGGRNRR